MSETTFTDHAHFAAIAASPTVGIQVDIDGHPLCAGVCRERATILILWDRPDAPTFCQCDTCRATPACIEHTLRWIEDGDGHPPWKSYQTLPEGWRLGDGWPQ